MWPVISYAVWEKKGMIQTFISVFSVVWDQRTMSFIIL